jgi:ankyrin repeat protein
MTLEGIKRRAKEKEEAKEAKEQKKKANRQKKKQLRFTMLGGAHSGNLKLVRRMVEKKGVGVDKSDIFGSTALFFAAAGGHIKLLQFLLQAGSDINHINKEGGTALLYASQKAQFKTIKFLIDKGAALDAGFGPVPPLHAAASHNEVELMKQLISQGGLTAPSAARADSVLDPYIA